MVSHILNGISSTKLHTLLLSLSNGRGATTESDKQSMGSVGVRMVRLDSLLQDVYMVAL